MKQMSSPFNREDVNKDVLPRVHLGKYFKDLTPRLKIQHFLMITVTKADNMFLMYMALNLAPIHLDHKLPRENGGALCTRRSDSLRSGPLPSIG